MAGLDDHNDDDDASEVMMRSSVLVVTIRAGKGRVQSANESMHFIPLDPRATWLTPPFVEFISARHKPCPFMNHQVIHFVKSLQTQMKWDLRQSKLQLTSFLCNFYLCSLSLIFLLYWMLLHHWPFSLLGIWTFIHGFRFCLSHMGRGGG